MLAAVSSLSIITSLLQKGLTFDEKVKIVAKAILDILLITTFSIAGLYVVPF